MPLLIYSGSLHARRRPDILINCLPVHIVVRYRPNPKIKIAPPSAAALSPLPTVLTPHCCLVQRPNPPPVRSHRCQVQLPPAAITLDLCRVKVEQNLDSGAPTADHTVRSSWFRFQTSLKIILEGWGRLNATRYSLICCTSVVYICICYTIQIKTSFHFKYMEV